MIRSLALLSLLFAGCVTRVERTETLVTIDVDPALASEVTNLHVNVFGGANGDSLTLRTEQDLGGAIVWPVVVALTPEDGDANRVFVVEGIATSGSTVLGTVRARSGYVAGRTLALRLVLESCCRAIAGSCSMDETCRSCACVTAERPPSSLPDWSTDAGPVPGSDAPLNPDAGVPDAPDANGSDTGELDAAPDAGSDSGTDGGTPTFTPRNLPSTVWDDASGTGGIVVTSTASIDTDTGVVLVDGSLSTGFEALSVTSTGECADIFVIATESFRIDATAIVTVTGTRGLAIAARGAIVIAGTIDVGAHGTASGPGGLVRSGGGGYGSDGGANGCTTSPASAFGNPELTGLCGGSTDATGGGGAGGAVELASLTSVTVEATGTIRAVGGGGPFTPITGGGHGGSGGGVLIVSPLVTLAGTISVNGGGGASGYNAMGGPGSDGPLTTAATGGMRGCTMIGCGGQTCSGSGGTGAWQNGPAGAGMGGMVTCGGSGCMNGGFGGGGAGRIRVEATTTDFVTDPEYPALPAIFTVGAL